MPSPILLKKLLRIEKKLTSVIASEKLEPPSWYDNLLVAITTLEQGYFKKFQTIFCSLNIKYALVWKFTLLNQQILTSILSNLEKLQAEICSEKYEDSLSVHPNVNVILGIIGAILLISGMFLAWWSLGLFRADSFGALGLTFVVVGALGLTFVVVGIIILVILAGTLIMGFVVGFA